MQRRMSQTILNSHNDSVIGARSNRHFLSIALLLGAIASCSSSETAAPEPDAMDQLVRSELIPVVPSRIAELEALLAAERLEANTEEPDSVDPEEVRGIVSMYGSARDKRMRDAAKGAVQELGPAVVGHLSALLLDKEEASETRRISAILLAAIGADAAVEPLVEVFETSDEVWLRRVAVWAIGESGSDAFTLRLILRLKYEVDSECVIWLADSLSRVGNLAGLDGLVNLTYSGEQSIADLARARLADLAERSGTESAEEMTSLWESADASRLREKSASSALRLATWKKVSELSSEHFQLRGVDDARFILSRLGPWAAELIAEALLDTDSHLRLHSIQVLERMGARAKVAGPALINALPDSIVGHAAAEAIGRIGYVEALAVLDAGCDARHDHELRVACVRALGSLASLDSLPRLLDLFNTEASPADLKLASADALIRCEHGDPVADYLVGQMTEVGADARGAEVSLERWLVLGAQEERQVQAKRLSDSALEAVAAATSEVSDEGVAQAAESVDTPPFQAALDAWIALAGPHSLVITRQQVRKRRAARSAMLIERRESLRDKSPM